MRRAHDPSRLRRRRLRFRSHPQQQGGDARHLRGQCQLAAGDEIELPRLPPDFQHDTAERIAGQRVGGGPQRGVHIGGAHGHEQARIETEFGQSAHRHRAGFDFGEILPHPDQRPPCRRPSREACDKSRRRRTLPSLGEHLMHRADRKPALHRRVSIGMTERHTASRHRPRHGFRCARCCRARSQACSCVRRSCARPSWKILPASSLQEEPEAGSFVHDMF